MKRMVLVLVHLVILASAGVREDGILWLRERLLASNGLNAMEQLRGARALSVCLGASSAESVLPDDVDGAEDLIVDLCDCVVHGAQFWRQRGCLAEDGSWMAESGGHGDICSTLVATGFLLDLGVLPEGVIESGKSVIESWLGWMESPLHTGNGSESSEQLLRYRLESLVVLGLFRRNGLLSRGEEASLNALGTELLAEMARVHQENEDGPSVYDTALLVRGLCLQGRQDEVQALADVMAACVEPEGCWSDVTVGSAIAVTSAVVEALMGTGIAAEEITVETEFEAMAEESGIGIHTFGVKDVETGQWSVMLRDEDGKCRDVRWADSPMDTVRINTSVLAPGSYEVVIRLWNDGGGCQIGEKTEIVAVGAWFSVNELALVGLGVPSMVYAGDSIAVQPILACQYNGNLVKSGRVTGMISSPTGEAVAEFPELVWRGVAGYGSFTQPAGTWEGVLEQDGYYDVHIVLTIDGQEYVAHRLLYVGARSEVTVENFLELSEVTADAVSGNVAVCVQVENVGAASGLAAGFSAPEAVEAHDNSGDVQEICISGVVSGDGKKLLSGWLVVRVDYGTCVGGSTVRDYHGYGSLTMHEVVDGACRLGYVCGRQGVSGTLPMTVYAGTCIDGACECHDKIGVVELILE